MFLSAALILLWQMFNEAIDPIIGNYFALKQLDSTVEGFMWYQIYIGVKPYIGFILLLAVIFLLYDDVKALAIKLKNKRQKAKKRKDNIEE
ncbi:MAG: hypothetical protein ACOCQR_01445 [bacterium]